MQNGLSEKHSHSSLPIRQIKQNSCQHWAHSTSLQPPTCIMRLWHLGHARNCGQSNTSLSGSVTRLQVWSTETIRHDLLVQAPEGHKVWQCSHTGFTAGYFGFFDGAACVSGTSVKMDALGRRCKTKIHFCSIKPSLGC